MSVLCALITPCIYLGSPHVVIPFLYQPLHSPSLYDTSVYCTAADFLTDVDLTLYHVELTPHPSPRVTYYSLP